MIREKLAGDANCERVREVVERPILMSGPMVRAILDGKKTQTRRVMRSQPPSSVTDVIANGTGFVAAYPNRKATRPFVWSCKATHGVPGDRLWVREGWRLGKNLDALPWSKIAPGRLGRMEYEATPGTVPWENRGRLRRSRFMPRRLSRLTLELTEVRAERVQAIGEADATAEGFHDNDLAGTGIGYGDNREAFCCTWDALNAKRGYSWESNPWVWVLGFKLVQP